MCTLLARVERHGSGSLGFNLAGFRDLIIGLGRGFGLNVFSV